MDRELLLLGLLRHQDMHGYRLNEFIERDLAFCTDLKKATAYFLLDKMVKQGWVSALTEQEGARPQRRVYRLTDAGEAMFQKLLRENLAAFSPSYFPGDIGLIFADELPPEEVIDLLEARRQAMRAQRAEIAAVPAHRGSLQWAIDHRIAHLDCEITWLDSVLARINESANHE